MYTNNIKRKSLSLCFALIFSCLFFAEDSFAQAVCPLAAEASYVNPADIFNAGDLDADGFNDFIFTSLNSESNSKSVKVWSAKTFSQLTEFTPSEPNVNFGNVVVSAGDLDGDGYNDILVGEPTESSSAKVGSVNAYSVFGNKLLFNLPSPAKGLAAGNSSYGKSIASLGDINGDGKPEFAVGADLLTSPGAFGTSGAVFIHDGATRQVLNIVTFLNPEITFFGKNLFSVTDLNQDGHKELIVTAKISASDLEERGVLLVYSGLALLGKKNKALLGSLIPEEALINFGEIVVDIGDITGDKVAELAVSSPDSIKDSGDVLIVSTSFANGVLSFNPILNIPPALPANSNFGASMSLLSDIDGDNFPEFAVTSPLYSPGGLLEIFSLKTGVLLFSFTGESAALIGDINQDGFHELVASSDVNNSLYLFTLSPDRNLNDIPDRCELAPTADSPQEEDLSPYYNLMAGIKKSILISLREFRFNFPSNKSIIAQKNILADLESIRDLIMAYPKLEAFSDYLNLKNISIIERKLKKAAATKSSRIRRDKNWKSLVFLLKNLF